MAASGDAGEDTSRRLNLKAGAALRAIFSHLFAIESAAARPLIVINDKPRKKTHP
jgi:hypothetical protein